MEFGSYNTQVDEPGFNFCHGIRSNNFCVFN